MSEKEKRERVIKFRVNDSEYKQICKACTESGYSNLSDYLRIVSIHRCIFMLDNDELAKIRKFTASVSNNVNQIAIRINSTGKVYAEDLEELKKSVNKVWSLHTSILSLLHKPKK